MRTPGPQPLDLLPPPGDRVGGGPAVDAVDRPAVPRDPVLREPEDGGVLEAVRGGSQPQAGPTPHEADGAGGAASPTANDRGGARREGLPLPAARSYADSRGRGLEFGHHVCADEAWLHVPDGGDRLVQPLRPVLAAVEHAGGRLLFEGAGGGVGAGRSE